MQQKFIRRYKCYKLVHLRSDCSICNISGPKRSVRSVAFGAFKSIKWTAA